MLDNVTLQGLQRRPNTEEAIDDAHKKSLELLDPGYPTREQSVVYRDRNGKVLLAALSHHMEGDKRVNDGIPVSPCHCVLSLCSLTNENR